MMSSLLALFQPPVSQQAIVRILLEFIHDPVYIEYYSAAPM